MTDQDKVITEMLNTMDEHVLPKFVSEKRLPGLKKRDAVLVPWLDLNISFYIPLPEETIPDHYSSILVTGSVLKKSGHTAEELLAIAVRNLYGQTLMIPFEDIMQQICSHFSLPAEDGCPEEDLDEPLFSDPPIYFVSNVTKSFGAAVILCSEIRLKLQEIFGGPFLILPSSIHEVLCLPETDEATAGQYTEMVREINEGCVSPEDRLADHVYLCRNGVVAF